MERQKHSRSGIFLKLMLIILGASSLIWFLIRVIPKPSRATYPCQRAAFPIASAFIIWLTAMAANLFFIRYLKTLMTNNRFAVVLFSSFSAACLIFWLTLMPTGFLNISAASLPKAGPEDAVGYTWSPEGSNMPVGEAKGINPGRVVMARDPLATKWKGNWKLNEDQWWLDENTDISRIDAMLSVTLKTLTSAETDKEAWSKIFMHYNENSRGIGKIGYKKGEIVAIKPNLNHSTEEKSDNYVDTSPQMILSMVRQLVTNAGVPPENILIYDARRMILPYLLNSVWNEFPDVRFMQSDPAVDKQPVNPKYGNHRGLEAADWVVGITYSAGNYKEARLVPSQLIECTYLINLALLKGHSYPYNYMEDGNEGQTGITMCGKNHTGSIKGTPELHAILNTKVEGKKNAYSPLVDLAASPNIGGKTILYVLDALYCGRKHKSYPLHFPNPPFNNRVSPYENPDWPSSVLVSMDGVALESVGLDLYYAQSKNNTEPTYYNVPRIIIRENADDFLHEMASPENPPSGTKYIQAGKPVKSLGVHEHWESDLTMRYSRNLDPENGKGIEFILCGASI